MRSFTRGIWIAIHFQFIRATMTSMPRWLASMFNDAWLKIIFVCVYMSRLAIFISND